MSKYCVTIMALIAIFALTATSALAVLFDFSDPKQLDKWEVINKAGGKWEITNGALKLTAANARWDMIAIKDQTFTDGEIHFKLKWLSGTYCEVGSAYRIQNAPDFANYQIHLSTVEPSMRWGYCMKALDGGTWGPDLPRPAVKDWGKAPIDKWFEFRIVVKGNKHTTYAGPAGEMVMVAETTQGDLKTGKVGIVSYSGVVEETLIDDFEVTDGNPSAVDAHSKLCTTWSQIKTTY